MYIEKKKIAGKVYNYLKISVRFKDKVTTKTVAYLGAGDMSKEEVENAITKVPKLKIEKIKKEAIEKLKTEEAKERGKEGKEAELEEKAGVVVAIKTEEEEIKGTLLPSFDPSLLLLKLENGYNIGIERSKIKSIKKIGEAKSVEFPSAEVKEKGKPDKPGISLIATGGTIASRLDYATGAVKWLMTPEQLFFLAPKLFDIVKINKMARPFMIGSENMTPQYWQTIAKEAASLLNEKENQGIIITHGTDTLHYTGAALSFMLRNLNKPVVLTYSQRSTDRGSTDTVLNLTCSAYAALSNIAEVMLVGHATPNDDYCMAIRGVKARKMHSSRRDTFRPINELPIAKISEDGKITIINENFIRRNNKKVIADTKFDEKVALVKYYPGAKPDIIEYFANKGFKGIVVEAVGLGHVATEESPCNWLPTLKKVIDSGIVVCFAPQTLYGRLDPYVYVTGRKLLDIGVLFLEDMLPEVAYVKLGWVLGHERNSEKIKKLMLTNMAGELNKRISTKTFLY